MVCNSAMNDTELIAHLGGPTKVAKLLKLKKLGGAQRVQNWLTRGIPSDIKIAHPTIFLRKTRKTATEPTGA